MLSSGMYTRHDPPALWDQVHTLENVVPAPTTVRQPPRKDPQMEYSKIVPQSEQKYRVFVTPGNVITTGSILVTPGSVVVPTGSVVTTDLEAVPADYVPAGHVLISADR
ncbi:hypothetical protein Tco_0299030, partial [Tanacetum coccineum]